MTPAVDILIPMYRPPAAVVALTSLCTRTFPDFQVIVSDRTEEYDALAAAHEELTTTTAVPDREFGAPKTPPIGFAPEVRMPRIDVLVPTCNRPLALAMTLAGLALQDRTDYRVVVADQSDAPVLEQPTIAAVKRILEERCIAVAWHYRPNRLGIAEQRQFLLEQAGASYVLYLDDDVLMEPWVLTALVRALDEQGCGFIGAFPAGLSFRDDVRPHQQHIEFWEGRVRPETIEPDSPAWERRHLHRAANLYHATRRHAPPHPRLYKVAWVASCALYDRAKLLEVGGFGFWRELPRYHSGEEVLAQNLLMRRYGGAGLMPSGTYHAEEPSTVLNAAGTVDGHALELLPAMIDRYARHEEAHV